MKNENTNVENASVVATEVKVLGRPVNADSARQKKLAKIEALKAAGEFKLGRPTKEGSARQIRLAEMEAKRVANGGELKKGRPTKEGSKRQKQLAERAAKEAAGITITRGRPKAVKAEVVTEPVIADVVNIDTPVVKAKRASKKK